MEANKQRTKHHNHHTTVLWPFFWDHPGEPVPEENFWNLWCKGRLTEADTLIIRLGATPIGLTSVHLHQFPYFFTGRMPFLPPNQQCQSTEGKRTKQKHKMLILNKHTKKQNLNVKPTLNFKNCLHVSLCAAVVHNTAQNGSDSFPGCPPDNHHSLDVYWRGGGSIGLISFDL